MITIPFVLRCKCGRNCDIEDWGASNTAEPCWGQVDAVDDVGPDEDGCSIYTHRCQGHHNIVPYVDEPWKLPPTD